MKRTLQTEEERERLRQFLLAHSGRRDGIPQCKDHPPLADMNFDQLEKAMKQEMGFVPSRMTVYNWRRKLGLTQRAKPGPQPRMTPEERRQAENERWRRWYNNLSDKAKRQYRSRGNSRQPAPTTGHSAV